MARMMMPRMMAAGVLNAETFDDDAFIAALEQEQRSAGAPIIWDFAYLTIARKPA